MTDTCRAEGCSRPVLIASSGKPYRLCADHQVAYRRGDRFPLARPALERPTSKPAPSKLTPEEVYERRVRGWEKRRGGPKPEPPPPKAPKRLFADDFDPVDPLDVDPTGGLSRGGLLQHRNPNSAAKERAVAATGGHVIATVKFGRDRLTTCAGCDFTATGRTDEEMKTAWDKHPVEMRPRGRRGPFPVETVPGSAAA